MKPTSQQLNNLKDYLRKELKFRESFEEIFDHILSALEHQPEDIDFQDAVNNIINQDFGGHNKLPDIEKRIASSIADDCNKKFRNFFIEQLKTPVVFYYLPFGAAIYFVLNTLHLPPATIEGIVVAIAFCPSLLALFRNFKVGYAFGDRTGSARDKGFVFTAWFPVWLSGALILWLPKLGATFIFNVIWGGSGYIIPAIFITLGVIYNVAIIKLYNDEFKFAK
ncbi:hypothetical protein ACFQZX_15270 [Mucilaginibacter litoreus]|uniref:DUF1700 domain-containing protein n=1 Tax=Mucilaginibacter litoreus TaxID=1048221 RepID=A0ABW3AV97_9SPHI